MRRTLEARVALATLFATAALACGASAPPVSPGRTTSHAALPDVRIAPGKPPLLLVAREGDPASAVAVAVSTEGIAPSADEAPEIATALAGVVEARLATAGLTTTVVPAWDGYRASVLVRNDIEAAAAADALRAALLAPIATTDLEAAKKKLAALAARPLRDPALGAWAKCVGSPFSPPSRVSKMVNEATAARLETARRAAHGTGRVALSVVGPRATTEAAWGAVSRGPSFPEAKAEAMRAKTDGRIESAVYEAALDGATPLEVHVTLDVPTASASVALAEALGDAHGPLAARLASLDPPFRLREVAGTAHVQSGCVGVVLDAGANAKPTGGDAADVASRVADAVALVHAEARVHLGEGGARIDGRALARRAGDAQKAAERAAWWGLVSPAAVSPAAASPEALRGSVALGIASRRGTAAASLRSDARPEAARDAREGALAAALERATAAWRRPVVEGRTRVESGQGEAWLLFGSPCGTDAETDTDAGLAAVVAMAAAEVARSAPDARVEPWVAPDGIGLVVHGPPREGETPAAHARRLADVVGRAFASEPLTPAATTRARAEAVRLAAPAFLELAGALAPRHPSWVAPFGREDVALRSADAAVSARAQALRAGPLRLAVLADADEAQGEAALRAVDRWVERRTSDAARTCGAKTTVAPAKAGTYATSARPSALPEAWLAYPLPPGDAATRDAAAIVAAALDGQGALLERALGGATPLAQSWQARVVGWPRSPALAVRVVATDASLDGAVLQARALLDRIRTGGLPAADHERATTAAMRASLATALDPRARVVATFRGEPLPGAEKVTGDQIRAFAARHLVEDGMIVVAARPPRGTTP